MSPSSKCNLFAVFVVLINWHYLVTTTVSSGSAKTVTSLGFSGGGLMILLTGIYLFILARRFYSRLRAQLAKGEPISSKEKWIYWTPCIFLLPVFIRATASISESSADRTITRDWGYGTDSPMLLFSLCAVAMILYQIDANMTEFAKKQKNG